MTDEEVIRLLKIEHACSQAKCDRNCSCCDIVQEQETLDVMYKKAIQLIEERAELEDQIENMQIVEYSNLHEQRKKIHKNLIDGFTEQLGIMDKEEDVLFSLKEIKSTINFIMELE